MPPTRVVWPERRVWTVMRGRGEAKAAGRLTPYLSLAEMANSSQADSFCFLQGLQTQDDESPGPS
jgi:hypothetical protein